MNPTEILNTAHRLPEEDNSVMGGRSFLSQEKIRNVVRDGKSGYLVRVGLTSYRSLPLSCLEKIELSVDGQAIQPEDMRLIYNGHAFKLDELKNYSDLFWFILDDADLFVLSPEPLPAGEHYLQAALVTVEPYVTGGRFSFFNTSKKYLSVSEG